MRVTVLALLGPVVLAACSSTPAPGASGPVTNSAASAPASQADPLSESAAPAPSPSEEGSATAASSVFYMEAAEGGCYAYSEEPTQNYLIGSDTYKEFYSVDCFGPHHFEVFHVTDVPEEEAPKGLTQKIAEKVCAPAYVATFGQPSPLRILSPEEQAGTPYLRWFFPDKGLEDKRYPGRVVCYVHTSDPEYAEYTLITEPLIPRA